MKKKLPQGFYEVEAVRQKRFHKGKIQYLVKWRGWEESANTWEPKANLKEVFDIVDAFEASLRSSKNGIVKKRKDRSGDKQSQTKKKQKQKQQASPSEHTYDVPLVKIKLLEKPLPITPLDNSDGSASEETGRNVCPKNGDEVSVQVMENGVGAVLTRDEDVNAHKPNGTIASKEGKKRVTFLEEVDFVEESQSGCLIGSQRRKSRSVKKFTISSEPRESLVEPTGISVALNGCCGGKELDPKNNSGVSKSVPTITRIVKPVAYSTSVVNNVYDVLVTFRAMRSDGTEVLVDNKYLKANNPLVLIDFYEEHIKYNQMEGAEQM